MVNPLSTVEVDVPVCSLGVSGKMLQLIQPIIITIGAISSSNHERMKRISLPTPRTVSEQERMHEYLKDALNALHT